MGWSSGKCQMSCFASCNWTASLASFFSYLIRWYQALDLSAKILKKHSRRWKRFNTSFATNGANMRAVVNPPHQVSPLLKNEQAVMMSVTMSEKTRATLKAKNLKSSHQRWHLDSFLITGAEKYNIKFRVVWSGFLNQMLRHRRWDVTSFCMQLGNREDRKRN